MRETTDTSTSSTFRRACGHVYRANPLNKYAWLRAAREPCMRCMLEAKATRKEKS